MKIFISWSGGRSKAVAELISLWIKCVLQASRPWISTRDIDRGAVWFSEISDQLAETSAGIVCLTQENKDRPWILFETGALAKGLSSNRVCTFLVDLEPRDLQDPLAQFNHTLPERTSMWELVRTLNAGLEAQRLDERILVTVFDTYWPQFEDQFTAVLANHPSNEKPAPRSDSEILLELLDNTRNLSTRIRQLETSAAMPQRTHKLSQLARASAVLKPSNALVSMIKAGMSDGAIIEKICNEWVIAPHVAVELLSEAKRDMEQGLDLV